MREVEIERLLHWAYRDELPKRGIGNVANSWEPVSGFGEYLTVIDDEPGFPVIMGPPHPDALTIERAVRGLAEKVKLSWLDFKPLLMGDLMRLAPAVSPIEQRSFSEVALVECFARMGKRPVWNTGKPAPQRMLGRNNKPVLIGLCKDTGRYTEGSHCPLQYTAPTIEQLVMRRAEYLVWRGALVSLTGTLLAWTLNDHLPLKPDAPLVPWLDVPAPARPAAVGGVAPAWRTWTEAEQRQRPLPAVVPSGA